MSAQEKTTEYLVGRWEDLRDIKNLMGRMVNAVQLNRNLGIFDSYWSRREDISLGFNDGFYRGQEAVGSYYQACFAHNCEVAQLLQEHFPEMVSGTMDDIYGVGEMRALPLSSPLVIVARDRETAKGLWTCLGNSEEVRACGPASYWVWGYYAADFIRENDEWKIWHLMFLADVHHLGGQSWAQPEQPLEELAEFAALKNYRIPEFTERVKLHSLYDGTCKRTVTPRIPVPYETFSETFSYGEAGGASNE